MIRVTKGLLDALLKGVLVKMFAFLLLVPGTRRRPERNSQWLKELRDYNGWQILSEPYKGSCLTRDVIVNMFREKRKTYLVELNIPGDIIWKGLLYCHKGHHIC